MGIKFYALGSALIFSTAVHAADAVDSSVREYILSRMTASGEEWYKDDLSDITSRQKEIGKRPRVGETSDIKKKITAEKAKLIFIRDMRPTLIKGADQAKLKSLVAAAVNGATERKNIQDALEENKKIIEKNTLSIGELEAKKAAAEKQVVNAGSPEADAQQKAVAGIAREIESTRSVVSELEGKKASLEKQLSGLGQPIELENGLRLKAVGEKLADGKTKVKVELEYDPASNTKVLPKEVTDNLSQEDMKNLLEKGIGADLYERTFDANKKPDDIIREMSDQKVKVDIAQAVDEKISDTRAEIGSSEDPNSVIGKLQEELNEKTGVGRGDELKDLEAKRKIAAYLKSNPQAHEMEPCDLIMKAVGWAALSKQSKQECAEKDPARVQKERAENEKMNAENRKVQEEAQSARAKELADLQQHCEALYRQRAMADATNQVTQPINALMDKLVLQYNNSELYASLCAPQTSEGADEFDKTIAIDPTSEATRLAERMMDDPDKLKKEREAVSLVMRRAIYSLERSGNMMGAALSASQQTGAALDMSQLQAADSKVQRMATIYNCSKSILEAMDTAVAKRRMEINNKLGISGAMNSSMGASTNDQQGAVNVNSVGAASANRRTGQRPATQRANQILRSNRAGQGGGTAPAPNYMGN